MPFGLKEETVKKIVEVFGKHEEIEKAVIYGSRAKGNYSNGSDIDIVLFGDALNLNVLHEIENEIDDLLLPYTIDLSIYHNIKNEKLLEHINRVGIEFYANLMA